MIHLTKEQEHVYQLLFNFRSNITKSHNNQAIKQLAERFETLFGYPIFDCFLVDEGARKNLCYYLENIVLYTKFMTCLVPVSHSTFADFYHKIAEVCVEFIQVFCEESSPAEAPIYTSEFKEHLHNTIFFSLEPTGKDVERIQEIFRLKIAVITASAMIHYDTLGYMRSKPTLELSLEIREQRSRKKERQFVDDFLKKMALIMRNNHIKFYSIDEYTLKLKMYALQEKESVTIENTLIAGSRTASNLFAITLVLTLATAYLLKEKDPLAPGVFMMAALSLIVSCLMRPGEKGKVQAQQAVKNTLVLKQKDLAAHLSLESIDYGKEEKAVTPCKIFSFRPATAACIAEPSPMIVPPTRLPQLPRKKEQEKEEEPIELSEKENPVVSALPEGYYRNRNQNQNHLVFFKKELIDKKGRGTDFTLDPAAFEAILKKDRESSIDARVMDPSEKKQWARVCPGAHYKVYPPHRKGNTTRYFGIKEEHTVNGENKTVCNLRYWVSTTH